MIRRKSLPFWNTELKSLMNKRKFTMNEQEKKAIKIGLLDGREFEGESWKTTPFDIAMKLDKNLAYKTIVAKVNGQPFDLERPLEKDSIIEFLDFDTKEGKDAFWHSSAHLLGLVCELNYKAHLSHGPPTDEGFFYDMGMEGSVSPNDFSALNGLASDAAKANLPFERLELSKEQLLDMFKYNKFKQQFIQEKIADGEKSTVYRCGPLIDLCRGPHVRSTSVIKAFEVLKNSSSYFLGDSKNESLQRVYGVSFPDAKQLKEYKKFLEEADKRDHRKIGAAQELFFFHEYSPGSCFFLPHGARIYNTLIDFIKGEYRKRGFSEVITPNIYNSKLWEISGHWQKYKENMFTFDVEKEQMGLKPMNCPGHCLMFGHRERSYRELPIRFADFGVLHRNEYSGALSGLTRVRRFQQDDAHIFCRVDQLTEEITNCLDFLKHVYGIFGFNFYLKLSTRPENYLGDLKTWEEAEKRLEQSLNDSKFPWTLNPGDGAFYGPKIDITIEDAHRRKHQCATIQLDFQLPEHQLKLSLRAAKSGENAFERPVIIHRAILGSVERMMAILTENFAGKWPLWLSPRQVCIVPVSAAQFDYASKVRQTLHDEGFFVDADLSDLTLNKKVRNAQQEQYNIIVVVGGKEETDGTVNVRRNKPEGKDRVVSIQDFVAALHKKKNDKSMSNDLF
ncbi:cytoplasmic threonine-tRNA ligase Trs1 [Rozella allomycis CSF55]|uniref:Threonine--tRNA ligase, cytoplasmic n=1 Tax=Rozella allomycis (strain CSF55) TaxID=988480 RepID=A0A4P9YNX1_ROZAC|nr:cytoplasmic threonine-tRNA ligase Trs1 [Rozella allomycis CSF55]